MKFAFKKTFVYSLFTLLFWSGCVKDEFDNPPLNNVDPNVIVTHSLRQIKQLLPAIGTMKINNDWIISGIVVADDNSGNFYKEIIIQDSSGGASIQVDITDFNTQYPVGRKVFVKLKGLVAGFYNNGLQIGTEDGTDIGRIAQTLVPKYVLKGKWGNKPTPQIKEISQLTDNDIYTLVTIKDVEFLSTDTALTLADGINKIDANRTFKTCGNQSMLLRTSGFADFANNPVPKGNGAITGIYAVYGADQQLYVRNMSDFVMGQPRCNSQPSGPVSSYNETFDSGTLFAPVDIPGWKAISVVGGEYWITKSFSGDYFAECTAYNTGLSSMESWLISPPIDFDVANTLQFTSAMAFHTHDGLSVWISTDFDGTNVTTATWQPITCTLANSGSGNYNMIASGAIDLSTYSGVGYIGYKYLSNSSTETTTFRIDNFSIQP